MDKEKKRDRAFLSSKKREEKRATPSGEKLALPFILGGTYPADHPYAAGSRPVVYERVAAVAAGETNALPRRSFSEHGRSWATTPTRATSATVASVEQRPEGRES